MTLISRRTVLSRSMTAAAATAIAGSKVWAATPSEPFVYVGCTSHKAGEGIHVGKWDANSDKINDFRVAFPCASPSFLAVKKGFLFAGYATVPHEEVLGAFRIGSNGDLTLINTIRTPGADFVHMMLDTTGHVLVAPNYGKGTVLSFKVAADGHVSDPVANIQLTGSGPIASRQKSSHAHGVCFSPNNRFVYINDLGSDHIFIYKLNVETAELTPAEPASFVAKPGSGPRHLAFHPNRKWAYSINELDSTLTQYTWNPQTGALTLIGTFPTLPPDGDVANNRAGEIAFDKAGRFLYSCNRGGAEELLTYSVAADGSLKLIARTPNEGKEARHFVVSPDDKHLLLAKQFGNEVSVFDRNVQTGALTQTSARYPVDGASCVLFAKD